MDRHYQKQFLVFVFVGLSVWLGWGENLAALTLHKIVVSPPETELKVGSTQVALVAKASGESKLTFKWELVGSGEFKGDPEHSAIVYVPPDRIDGDAERVIISVRVTDEQGQEATDSVIFTINVNSQSPSTGTPTPTKTPTKIPVPSVWFNFVEEAPSATWKSDAGTLPFNGERNDRRGFAVWSGGYRLEDNSKRTGRRVLQTHPRWGGDGYIAGEFRLPGVIQEGDRFIADVGFLMTASGSGAAGTDEFIVIAYGGSLSSETVVARVIDTGQDGVIRPIDIDLSNVAGATYIRLLVEDRSPDVGQDWAAWLDARIER